MLVVDIGLGGGKVCGSTAGHSQDGPWTDGVNFGVSPSSVTAGFGQDRDSVVDDGPTAALRRRDLLRRRSGSLSSQPRGSEHPRCSSVFIRRSSGLSWLTVALATPGHEPGGVLLRRYVTRCRPGRPCEARTRTAPSTTVSHDRPLVSGRRPGLRAGLGVYGRRAGAMRGVVVLGLLC